jgi:hypothetical protein
MGNNRDGMVEIFCFLFVGNYYKYSATVVYIVTKCNKIVKDCMLINSRCLYYIEHLRTV